MKKRSEKTIVPERWAARWASAAGTSSAVFVGMTDDGRACLHWPPGAVLTAHDVAEVIGEKTRGARFAADGCLIVRR